MTKKRPELLRDRVDPEQRENLRYVQGRLMSVLVKNGVTKSEAEDIVSTALIRLIGTAPGVALNDREPLLKWLTRVGMNLMIDEYRARAARRRLAEAAGRAMTPEPGLPPGADRELGAARANRDRVLAALRPDQRVVFIAWAEQAEGSITRAEAAARLGCSIAEFEAAKKRVRSQLEKTLASLNLAPDDLWHEATPADVPAMRRLPVGGKESA